MGGGFSGKMVALAMPLTAAIVPWMSEAAEAESSVRSPQGFRSTKDMAADWLWPVKL